MSQINNDKYYGIIVEGTYSITQENGAIYINSDMVGYGLTFSGGTLSVSGAIGPVGPTGPTGPSQTLLDVLSTGNDGGTFSIILQDDSAGIFTILNDPLTSLEKIQYTNSGLTSSIDFWPTFILTHRDGSNTSYIELDATNQRFNVVSQNTLINSPYIKQGDVNNVGNNTYIELDDATSTINLLASNYNFNPSATFNGLPGFGTPSQTLQQVLSTGNDTGGIPIFSDSQVTLQALDPLTFNESDIYVNTTGISSIIYDNTSGYSINDSTSIAINGSSQPFSSKITYAAGGSIYDMTFMTYNITTTDATPIDIELPISLTPGFGNVEVSVRGTDTASGRYGAKLFGVFFNTGQVGTTDKTENSTFTTATSDIIQSGVHIYIRLTGEASTTISWSFKANVFN